MRWFGKRELTLADLGIEVGKLSVKEGDIVMFTCARPLEPEQAKALRLAWDRTFPGIKAIVVEPGISARAIEAVGKGDCA